MSIKFSSTLIFCFLAVNLILLINVNDCDGFKVRDSGSESSSVQKISYRKSLIQDIYDKKVSLKTKTTSSSDGDDGDDDDDDEDDENYVFEKVRRQHYEIPERKLKPAFDNVDDDDGEDEKKEVNSTFSFSDFFGKIFGKKADDESEDGESEVTPGIFDWFRNKRQSEETSTQTEEAVEAKEKQIDEQTVSEIDVDETDADEVPAASEEKNAIPNWKQFLMKTPLNSFLHLDADEKSQDEEDEVEQAKTLQVESKPVKSAEPKMKKESTAKNPNNNATGEPKKAAKGKQKIAVSPEDFERLLLNLPSFVPNYTRVQNLDCRRQGQIFQRQLRGQKLWALQMMDANAKITSGLLRGNINQLGDFDLCTSIATKIKVTEEQSIRMRGKYCLTHIDVVAIDENLKLPVHLLQGRNFIKSSINDPNHFIPRFTTINWGLCLPAACNHEDAGDILKTFVKPYNSTGVKIYIEIEEGNCYTKHSKDWISVMKENWKISATVGFFVFTLVIVIVASVNDICGLSNISSILEAEMKEVNDEAEADDTTEQITKADTLNSLQSLGKIHDVLMSFSVKKTGRLLLGLDENEESNELSCLHGLKAFGTIMLFVSLKLIPIGRIPFTNRNYLTELFNSPLSIFLRTPFLYADLFLYISGFLAAYKITREIEEKGNIWKIWKKGIYGRIIRLTPALFAVLIFSAWIMEHISTGPQWGDVIQKNADLCKENLLQNIFFVQNWYPFEGMCAPHTYQLAVDIQLAFLAAPLVYLIHKYPTQGLGFYGLVHALSAATRYSTTIDSRLSPIVFHGMKLSQIYRTANLFYAQTIQRATPYLVGIGLGLLLREIGKPKISKGFYVIGTLASFVCFTWCFLVPSHMTTKDYQYNPSETAQYSALASLIWSVGLSWIVFVCVTKNSGKLNYVLSSKPMLVLSKLSYSIYLTQFLVFFYFAGTVRSAEEFQISGYLNRLEIVILILAALLIALLFDLPMRNIIKILFASDSAADNSVQEELVEGRVVENVEEAVESQKAEEVEFESPFADDEDDYITRRNSMERDTDIRLSPSNYEFKGKSYEDSETESTINWDEGREANYRHIGSDPEEDQLEVEEDIEYEDDVVDNYNRTTVKQAEIAEPEEEEEEEESEEEDDEDDYEIKEEEEIIKRPPSTTMNAKKWRWDIQDD